MNQRIFELSEIAEVAKEVLTASKHPIYIFNGAMGAGKTTFIKAFCHELGVKSPTSSPTFSLVNEYETSDGKIFHFDMYRLKSEEEALDFGFEDYLYSGHRCLIEWAEKIPNLLPYHYHVIDLVVLENGNRSLSMR